MKARIQPNTDPILMAGKQADMLAALARLLDTFTFKGDSADADNFHQGLQGLLTLLADNASELTHVLDLAEMATRAKGGAR